MFSSRGLSRNVKHKFAKSQMTFYNLTQKDDAIFGQKGSLDQILSFIKTSQFNYFSTQEKSQKDSIIESLKHLESLLENTLNCQEKENTDLLLKVK